MQAETDFPEGPPYQFQTEDELVLYVQERVVLSEEAIEILGVSRQRLHELKKAGRIVALVEGSKSAIFWRDELQALAKQLQDRKGGTTLGPGGSGEGGAGA